MKHNDIFNIQATKKVPHKIELLSLFCHFIFSFDCCLRQWIVQTIEFAKLIVNTNRISSLTRWFCFNLIYLFFTIFTFFLQSQFRIFKRLKLSVIFLLKKWNYFYFLSKKRRHNKTPSNLINNNDKIPIDRLTLCQYGTPNNTDHRFIQIRSCT